MVQHHSTNNQVKVSLPVRDSRLPVRYHTIRSHGGDGGSPKKGAHDHMYQQH